MKRLALIPLALLLLAAGCSTPASRIKKNPELFNALPPEIQENVRQGRIDIGYPQDAVLLALGRPNREYTRRTANAQTIVWSYTREEIRRDRQRVDTRVRVYDADGRSRTVSDWVWVDVENRQEYERLRIEFTSNLVTAIETNER
jgi:hypothetical protein